VQSILRNRVREARGNAGLTQIALCELASIARQTLVVIERDNGYEPTAAVMGRLSDALGDPLLFWRETKEGTAA
jgi:DNA-binding XRE family transcriptional regulator